MPKKLFIIDAFAHIFRSYYAIRNLRNNAVYGFTRILLRLIEKFKPDHIVTVFDSSGPTFRHDLYPAYKANRAAMPDDLRDQLPLIHEVIDAFAIPKVSQPGLEADDLIATLAHHARQAGYEVYVVTSDKDLFQLVDDGVFILDPGKNDRILDATGVKEAFGVAPDKVADVLALMGDSSDNVPGARGIGPKTAIQLIEQYGNVDALYDHLHELKGKKQENLAASRDAVALSRKLVTLAPAETAPIKPDDCAYSPPAPEQIAPVLKKLNFQTLLKELGVAESTAQKDDYRLVNTPDALQPVLAELKQQRAFAFDFETCDLDTITPKLAGISFCWKPGAAVYIPFISEGQPVMDAATVLSELKPLFENPAVGKVGHNLKYEYQLLQANGIALDGIQSDTMIESYLLDAGFRHHSLDELAPRYLGRNTITYEDLTGGRSFCELSDEAVYRYACEDSDVSLQLSDTFRPRLAGEGVRELYETIERPLIPVLGDMERTGVLVDRSFLEALSAEFASRLDTLEADIYREAGVEFNINSPKQLGFILFEKMGLPVIRKTRKTKSYSTSHEVLEELAASHRIARLIVDYRMFAKLKSTYVDTLPELIHPATGRIHTSYNQTVAATGRLSSSNPNLQNIPIRTPEGQRIREAFIAPEGHLLVAADYSQVELRVLAHLSEDDTLIGAFERGEDIHTRTASELFGVKPDAVTPELRSRAKAINFGVIYGKREFSLARELGIPVAEARDFIAHYFERMPKVRAFIDRTIEQTRENGFVTTLFGRRRPIPDITSKNGNLRQAAERMAVNTPIQGTAADLIKLAMIRCHDRLRQSGLAARMIMQVHDELIFEVPESEVEAVSRLARDEMEQVANLRVPLAVNIGTGHNWQTAK